MTLPAKPKMAQSPGAKNGVGTQPQGQDQRRIVVDAIGIDSERLCRVLRHIRVLVSGTREFSHGRVRLRQVVAQLDLIRDDGNFLGKPAKKCFSSDGRRFDQYHRFALPPTPFMSGLGRSPISPMN